jgi:protein phosphatase
VRGREYSRIIYGPGYDVPANLERLRKVSGKRALALREVSLSLVALHRFVGPNVRFWAPSQDDRCWD